MMLRCRAITPLSPYFATLPRHALFSHYAYAAAAEFATELIFRV